MSLLELTRSVADPRPARRAAWGAATIVGGLLASSVASTALGQEVAQQAAPALALLVDDGGLAGCASASELRSLIVAKSGSDPFHAEPQPNSPASVGRPGVEVVFRKDRGTAAADLRVTRGGRTDARTLRSRTADCQELSEAIALALVVLLDPEPVSPAVSEQPAPIPAPAAPPVVPVATAAASATAKPAALGESSNVDGLLFARLWLGGGYGPDFNVGPSLGGGFGIEAFELRVELSWAPPTSQTGQTALVTSQRVVTELLPCYRRDIIPSLKFIGCVPVHVGAAFSSAESNLDGVATLDSTQAQAGVGLRPGLRFELGELLAFAFEVEGLLQAAPLVIGETQRGFEYRGGNFAGRLLVGVDLRFE